MEGKLTQLSFFGGGGIILERDVGSALPEPIPAATAHKQIREFSLLVFILQVSSLSMIESRVYHARGASRVHHKQPKL